MRSCVGRSAMLRPSRCRQSKKECSDRQLGAQFSHIQLAAEATHRDLKRMRADPTRRMQSPRHRAPARVAASSVQALRFPERRRSLRSGPVYRLGLHRLPCGPGCARRPSSTRTPLRLEALARLRPRRRRFGRAWAQPARTARAGILPRPSVPSSNATRATAPTLFEYIDARRTCGDGQIGGRRDGVDHDPTQRTLPQLSRQKTQQERLLSRCGA